MPGMSYTDTGATKIARRPRSSPYPLTSMDKAFSAVLNNSPPKQVVVRYYKGGMLLQTAFRCNWSRRWQPCSLASCMCLSFIAKAWIVRVAACFFLYTFLIFCFTCWQLCSISDAFGHVLAENVRARGPLPHFPASIMDGYAVIGKCLL